MKRAILISFAILALFLIGKNAAAQEAPPPPAAPTPPSSDTRVGLSFKGEYDHSFSNLYGLAIDQNGARIAGGAQTRRLSAYATLELSIGATPQGLQTQFYAAGLEFQYRALPYLRLGGGVRGEVMLINRATPGEQMGAAGYGLFASADFDVIRWGAREDHGAFLGARMNVDLFNENDSGPVPVMYGPELHVGIRF